MLTQEEINKVRSAAGAPPIQAVKQPSLSDRLGLSVAPKEPNYLERTAGQYQKSAQDIGSSISRGSELMAEGKPLEGIARAGLGSAGAFARAVFAPLTEIISPIISQSVEKSAKERTEGGSGASGGFFGQLATSPQAQKLFSAVEDWASKNPDQAKNLQDTIDIALSVVGSPIVNKGAQTGVQTGLKTLEKTLEGIPKLPQQIKSGIKGIGEKVVSPLKGKTMEEVLATSEKDLYKLSPSERKFYFENSKKSVIEKAKTAEQKVKSELLQRTNVLQTEAETLNKELAKTSRDKVIELRPKITKALGKQSQEYRRLVEEELAPHRDIEVYNNELSQFIDNKYAGNLEQAQAVKTKLGIPGVTPSELPTINVGIPDTTIGKIYDQAKALKQEIGGAAKKGTKVYSPDEKLIDDSVSVLTDFMKSKGVDLKNATQFWAKYAPVRNQLISEAKPFLQSGTQTKGFANTLMRVAKEVDVNNENFINEVENLVGEPITKENKAIVSKLKQNEKDVLTKEIEAQTKRADIELERNASLKKLSNKEFEVNRRSAYRSILKKILYAASGLGINEILKKYLGIGI